MKKAVIGMFAAIIILSFGTVSALAAGPGRDRSFTDADRNWICDFAGAACRRADQESTRGSCGVCLQKYGECFADADGDGVCDNYSGQRRGLGQGFHGGCGR